MRCSFRVVSSLILKANGNILHLDPIREWKLDEVNFLFRRCGRALGWALRSVQCQAIQDLSNKMLYPAEVHTEGSK
jgi:hypothetical protein